MLSPSSAFDVPDGFAPPADTRRDTSFLRQRVAALTRTVDEREATIATLMRHLNRARNDPSHSAFASRLSAGAAQQMSAPLKRLADSVRSIRSGFDAIEKIDWRSDTRQRRPHLTRAAMPELLHHVLDDLDRIRAAVRARENFSSHLLMRKTGNARSGSGCPFHAQTRAARNHYRNGARCAKIAEWPQRRHDIPFR
jgi:hypothetical protein